MGNERGMNSRPFSALGAIVTALLAVVALTSCSDEGSEPTAGGTAAPSSTTTEYRFCAKDQEAGHPPRYKLLELTVNSGTVAGRYVLYRFDAYDGDLLPGREQPVSGTAEGTEFQLRTPTGTLSNGSLQGDRLVLTHDIGNTSTWRLLDDDVGSAEDFVQRIVEPQRDGVCA